MRALLSILLLFSVAVPALADDQDKAVKQLRMITAISRDDTARAIVNREFAEVFKVERSRLVLERKTLGLNYGNLFLAHELAAAGSNMEQISNQLRAKKTAIEFASSSGVDWKRVASDAKKMNSRINNCIYKHFLHPKPDRDRDAKDQYVAGADLIHADADSTPDEVLSAQKDFLFWRSLAGKESGGGVDETSPAVQDYQQAREDIATSRGEISPGSPMH